MKVYCALQKHMSTYRFDVSIYKQLHNEQNGFIFFQLFYDQMALTEAALSKLSKGGITILPLHYQSKSGEAWLTSTKKVVI